MNQIKKYLSVLLMLTLVLSALTACSNEEIASATETMPTQIQETAEGQTSAESAVSAGYYQVGDKIEDFTITTYDGREISLYKVLEEKDMVLLNLWATWCGPCGNEFPAMQEAYEMYHDKVEIIALSVEPTDSDEVLADYVQEKGMSFCVARDTAGLESRIQHNGIPTSVVVDRFGTICLIEVGAMPYPEVFTNLFDIYTAEDYTQPVFLPSMLSELPTVQPADPAQLNDALNGEGGTLVFTNSSNSYHWPMTVEQKDGRTVAAASNCGSEYSIARVETQVDVKSGDVLVVEYKLDNNINTSILSIEVDGKSVKKTFWNRDWNTFAYRFEEAGNHRVSVSLDIEWLGAEYYTNLWIDSVRVVSGEEADKALENNPTYPVGDQTQVKLMNETVKPAYIYDETAPDITEQVYFCPDSMLRLLVTLDETVDPENAYLEDNDYNVYPLDSCITEEGYVVEIPNTDAPNMYAGASVCYEGMYFGSINVFSSEEQANQYFDMLRESYGLSILWEYQDESVDIQEASGDATYTVIYVDQNGDPVPAVMCQVCDETMCQVFVSDANGICQFTLPAKSYEIHTLKLPEGYDGDTTTITKAPMQGGELTFTLTKK